jgi:hypothetical protein
MREKKNRKRNSDAPFGQAKALNLFFFETGSNKFLNH